MTKNQLEYVHGSDNKFTTKKATKLSLGDVVAGVLEEEEECWQNNSWMTAVQKDEDPIYPLDRLLKPFQENCDINPDDFPALKGNDTDELSIPTNLDEDMIEDPTVVSIALEDGSFVNVDPTSLYQDEPEEWEVVSDAPGTVISMGSSNLFHLLACPLSYRDALGMKQGRLTKGRDYGECDSMLPWVMKYAPLVSKQEGCCIKRQEKNADVHFDAHAVFDGVKNSRGGLQKYQFGRQPKVAKRQRADKRTDKPRPKVGNSLVSC